MRATSLLQRLLLCAQDALGHSRPCAGNLVPALHCSLLQSWRCISDLITHCCWNARLPFTGEALMLTSRWLCVQVVQAFVRQAMGFLDSAPSKEDKVELIKTLQSITEGKVNMDACKLVVGTDLSSAINPAPLLRLQRCPQP